MSKQTMDTPKNMKHTSRRLLRLLMEQKARFVLFLTDVHRPFDFGAWTG